MVHYPLRQHVVRFRQETIQRHYRYSLYLCHVICQKKEAWLSRTQTAALVKPKGEYAEHKHYAIILL